MQKSVKLDIEIDYLGVDMKRLLAFTLAELLIAMAVVGVIAILTVPNVTKNIFNRSDIVKIQATLKTLSDSVSKVKVREQVADLADSTLFLDKAKFFEDYFKLSRVCAKEHEKCFASSYKSINGDESDELDAIFSDDGFDSYSVILPSGVSVLLFTPDDYNAVGVFLFDINGKDAPNVIGRDLFSFRVLYTGEIRTAYYQPFEDTDFRKSQCLSGYSYGQPCLQELQFSDWKMDY